MDENTNDVLMNGEMAQDDVCCDDEELEQLAPTTTNDIPFSLFNFDTIFSTNFFPYIGHKCKSLR